MFIIKAFLEFVTSVSYHFHLCLFWQEYHATCLLSTIQNLQSSSQTDEAFLASISLFALL